MRYITVFLVSILGLSACQLAQPNSEWEGPIFSDAEEQTAQAPQIKSQQIVTVETILGPEERTEEQFIEEEVARQPVYGSFDERIARNVRVKQSDEYGITYEYKDVRIDEIAHLASDYCYNQKRRQAVLHDSQLFRNFSRRATFHCLELQN